MTVNERIECWHHLYASWLAFRSTQDATTICSDPPQMASSSCRSACLRLVFISSSSLQFRHHDSESVTSELFGPRKRMLNQTRARLFGHFQLHKLHTIRSSYAQVTSSQDRQRGSWSLSGGQEVLLVYLRVWIVSNAANRFLSRRIPDQIRAPYAVLRPRTINFDLPLFRLRVRSQLSPGGCAAAVFREKSEQQ